VSTKGEVFSFGEGGEIRLSDLEEVEFRIRVRRVIQKRWKGWRKGAVFPFGKIRRIRKESGYLEIARFTS